MQLIYVFHLSCCWFTCFYASPKKARFVILTITIFAIMFSTSPFYTSSIEIFYPINISKLAFVVIFTFFTFAFSFKTYLITYFGFPTIFVCYTSIITFWIPLKLSYHEKNTHTMIISRKIKNLIIEYHVLNYLTCLERRHRCPFLHLHGVQ